MADISVTQKPRGSNTWIWMTLAIISVAALMVWLFFASEQARTVAAIDEDGAPATATEAEGAAADGETEAATIPEIAGTPETFIGRRLRIENVEVAATLGPSAFWADVPGANPFLVLASPDMTQQPEISTGDQFTVRGSVAAVNDSLVNVWVESGAVNEQARDQAAFATHYLLAERMQREE